MAQWNSVKLTQKGLRLQAKAQAGEPLVISKAVVGCGYLPEGTAAADLTQLVEAVNAPADITDNKAAGDGTTAISIRVQNGATAFYFREIGLIAVDPDEGEILYAYTNAGDNADFMPARANDNIIMQDVTLITQIGNAENVEVNVSLVVEVTRNEFAELESKVSDNTAEFQHLMDSLTLSFSSPTPIEVIGAGIECSKDVEISCRKGSFVLPAGSGGSFENCFWVTESEEYRDYARIIIQLNPADNTAYIYSDLQSMQRPTPDFSANYAIVYGYVERNEDDIAASTLHEFDTKFIYIPEV